MKNIYRNKGFTLIELMITIFIIGIISAVAIPSLNRVFADMKLNTAGEEIATAIWYTQNLALKEEKEHRVTFNTVGNGNDLSVQRAKGGTWNTILNPFDKKNYTLDFDTDRQVKGVNIITADFGGITSVTFGSNIEDPGRPTDCGEIVIENDDLQRIVTVSPMTGKVKVGPLIETGSVNGTSPTQFDTDLTQSTDDYYNGYYIWMTTGTCACQNRRIIDYQGSNKTITVDPGFIGNPANGDSFVIVNF